MNDFLRRLLMLPPQGSTMAPAIDHLHYFVIITTMVGWLGVTIAAVYFIVRYRRRSEEQRTAHTKAPLAFEITVITGLLSLFLLWWAIGYVLYVRMRQPPANAMTVYVVGKQWMWKFSYPDGRSSINVLTVPAGRPIKLVMTSRDVLHDFYVPDFRMKSDVVPGRYTVVWFEADAPGVHQVMCTQYCGLLHSNMWASVEVLSPEDYDAWLRRTEPSPDLGLKGLEGTPAASAAGKELATPPVVAESTPAGVDEALAARGRDAAARLGCFNCHTIDGRPHIGPTWKGLYGSLVPLEGGGQTRADERYLTQSMMDPLAAIVRGFKPVMPSFQGKMTPADAAAIIEFMKSLTAGMAPAPVIPPWTGEPPEGQPQ